MELAGHSEIVRRTNASGRYKDGQLIECETNPHPLGQELRFYQGGDFTCSRVYPTRVEADGDVVERRNELLGLGDAPDLPAYGKGVKSSTARQITDPPLGSTARPVRLETLVDSHYATDH